MRPASGRKPSKRRGGFFRWRRAALTLPVLWLLVTPGLTNAADLHVDCSAVAPGDGSLAQPFDSLGSGFELGPTDRLLIRRGTTCQGPLRITGGGSPSSSAQVGAYGSGNLPRIVGTGLDAVRVEDASHLTVKDLDISNPGAGGPLGEADSIRNGIRVTAQDNNVKELALTGLVIHDVNGDLTKGGQGSAAIQITATGPPPVRFEDLSISGNEITSVSRSAISIMGSNDIDRPTADLPWPEASTGVLVRAGDGIVSRGTDGAVIEGNTVSRGNLAGRPVLDPGGPMCNAGIWAFRANNTLIRGNEVFDMEHNGCDGTGFDIDYRQDGTVVEGNYSHGNEGGFILLCTDTAIHRADVRFNLSVDDGTMINHGPCGIAEGILGDLSGVRMFNNTVVGDTPTVSIQLAVSAQMYQPGDFVFRNNLVFSKQPIAAIPCGFNCSHNAFFGLPPSGTRALTADPLLTDSFRMSPRSPLRGAGVPVPGGGEVDFFGNPIPAVPSIGFDQAPVKPAVGPSRPCLRARAELKRARLKVKRLTRELRRLRRAGASGLRVRAASRHLREASAWKRKTARQVRKRCAKSSNRRR
jgi:hypothetical protein